MKDRYSFEVHIRTYVLFQIKDCTTYSSYAVCCIAVVIRHGSNPCSNCFCLGPQLLHSDQYCHSTGELGEEGGYIGTFWEGGEGSLQSPLQVCTAGPRAGDSGD